ncbi:MAG: hypothetical protein HYS12_25260 [Planctomycetes bacterium]|nr:hypothetical protein [Planctomycetota bacterium]
MIDARSAQVLQEVFRRESRSVLQYVGDAFPWTTTDRTAALDRLQEILHEERDALARLGQFLYRNHIVPLVAASYPASFTALNFVSLDLILKRLIAFQEQSLAAVESDLASVKDAEARRQLESLRDVKARHLEALRSLAGAAPEPMVTS